MLKELRKQLQASEGRSELVIVVFCDIRGFTEFSEHCESPNIAMFIKRFYSKLLDKYFRNTVFAKPTGDGMLLVFRYTEENIRGVVKNILSACFKVIKEFPTMFKNDPMVNFATPANLGFGIARGTACCLYSGSRTVDYSGRILNLAARLKDLAHPRGIIIDGDFQADVIPAGIQPSFKKRRAYIRSIAEEAPHMILCSEEVKLPNYAMAPLMSHEWKLKRVELLVEQLKKLVGEYSLPLPEEVLAQEMTKLEMVWPHPKIPGYTVFKVIQGFEFYKDARGDQIRFPISKAQMIAKEEGLEDNIKVGIQFHYIPKPKGKKIRR